MTKKKVALAADHGGYRLKEAIKAHLAELGYAYTDLGTTGEERCDYPPYAEAACAEVIGGDCDCAILVCGTGIGMSLASNKINGIRAACCSDTYSAKMTRMHNDANALCLGGRVIGEGLALDIVDIFLTTDFLGGKHAERIAMVHEIEKKNLK